MKSSIKSLAILSIVFLFTGCGGDKNIVGNIALNKLEFTNGVKCTKVNFKSASVKALKSGTRTKFNAKACITCDGKALKNTQIIGGTIVISDDGTGRDFVKKTDSKGCVNYTTVVSNRNPAEFKSKPFTYSILNKNGKVVLNKTVKIK